MPSAQAWKKDPSCIGTLSRVEIESALGAPDATDADSGGLGPVEVWSRSLPCGLEIGVLRFLMSETGALRSANEQGPIEVYTSDRDAAHAAAHLALSADRLLRGPATRSPLLLWRLMRQDDNGNQFEIGQYSTHCEAGIRAAQMEALGHKQSYWVERCDGGRLTSR